MTHFSIIIPIKNQFKIVKICLESVLRHYKNQEIILIDDGSTEDVLVQYLKVITNQNLNWTLIINESSVGHSCACTKGIELSKNENLFLLNSDTILTKNSLNILSNILDENKDIAVVGPYSSSASGPQLLKNMYEKRFTISIEEIEKLAEELESNKDIQDLDLVNGFCFGIKKSVFQKIGGFDPVLSTYGNEKELLIRIRKMYYRTVHVLGSYVHHFGKMSYSHENINIGVAQRDADLYIMRKHSR